VLNLCTGHIQMMSSAQPAISPGGRMQHASGCCMSHGLPAAEGQRCAIVAICPSSVIHPHARYYRPYGKGHTLLE